MVRNEAWHWFGGINSDGEMLAEIKKKKRKFLFLNVV